MMKCRDLRDNAIERAVFLGCFFCVGKFDVLKNNSVHDRNLSLDEIYRRMEQ